ncbi:MAG: hypothetical protein F2567_11280 [Actinobacteria bacterium]|uniref:Unannotated protein n=1 Tax=freshwater metagenome TaxID=449393 RepID=A0A6J6GR23_9ZZZZ|nr:hypothetical protein [Actinomycetota bacterium]MTA43602.1 hypothetical protein [Actinomycetota bacterium]MTB23542.1 hypothetical protein [Actinomycetota bacterium]
MTNPRRDEINRSGVNDLEDERGVDVSQIQAQLRLSVPERVRTMVAVANTKIAMQEAAKNRS